MSESLKVTSAEVATLLDQIDAGVSPARAEQVRAPLRELFADAVDDGLIARSPVRPHGMRQALPTLTF